MSNGRGSLVEGTRSTVFNPFVYGFLNANFREPYKRMTLFRKCHQRVENRNIEENTPKITRSAFIASSDLSFSKRASRHLFHYDSSSKYFSLNDSSVHRILCIDDNLISKLTIPALAFRRSWSFDEQVSFLFFILEAFLSVLNSFIYGSLKENTGQKSSPRSKIVKTPRKRRNKV